MKASLHIQHNTRPESVEKLLAMKLSDPDATHADFAERLGCAESVADSLIIPFLRQLRVLEGWRLTPLGDSLAEMRYDREDLLGEALHVQLYTLHWMVPGAHFSFAYAALCDWLWERGEFVLDGNGQNELVGVVTRRAEEALGLNPTSIAFSQQSVQGATNWLRALDPAVLKENLFQRRHAASLHTLLWVIEAMYQRKNTARGIRLALDTDTETALCRACLIHPEALAFCLNVAQTAFDVRRPGGAFGIGSEGGLGRWLLLTRPMPLGHLTPI